MDDNSGEAIRRAAQTMNDDELVAYVRSRENRITLDELEQLTGKDGRIEYHDGTITAVTSDGTAVKTLRRPDDPPLVIS